MDRGYNRVMSRRFASARGQGMPRQGELQAAEQS